MARAIKMAIHDGGSGRDADLVGGTNDLDPALGGEFVLGQLATDFGVENFRSRAGHGVKACLFQFAQEIVIVLFRFGRAIPDFKWREGMDMHARQFGLDGADNVEIVAAFHLGVEAALNADLCAAPVPSLAGAGDNLGRFEPLGTASSARLAKPQKRHPI